MLLSLAEFQKLDSFCQQAYLLDLKKQLEELLATQIAVFPEPEPTKRRSRLRNT